MYLYTSSWWKCSYCLSPSNKGRSSGSSSSLVSLSLSHLHCITLSQNMSLWKSSSYNCSACPIQETQTSFVTLPWALFCLSKYIAALCIFTLHLSSGCFDWVILAMIRGWTVPSGPSGLLSGPVCIVFLKFYLIQPTQGTLGLFLGDNTLYTMLLWLVCHYFQVRPA